MTVDIKKLTVNTDDEREQWIEMLKLCSDYHYDMSAHLEPEIKGDDDTAARIHRAWGKAIQDANTLIKMWEIKKEDEIKRVE
jgi:hypothetical protein|tara:strand:+ start:256 stop:501 length:246 start_codon:yes stop_codon:yes gene_type:complete